MFESNLLCFYQEIFPSLSYKEIECLCFIKYNFDIKVISCALNVSIQTIQARLNHIYEKLNVKNKTELHLLMLETSDFYLKEKIDLILSNQIHIMSLLK
jgi:DNA-binding CsgD family transcriptional regulator